MAGTDIERAIINETQGLSREGLKEVLNFIRFTGLKKQQKPTLCFAVNAARFSIGAGRTRSGTGGLPQAI
jgi:hypothetical protein